MENIYFQVLELNTRRRTFKDEVEDCLYGDDYKKHKCETLEEAYKLEKELNKKGISTSVAKVHEVK